MLNRRSILLGIFGAAAATTPAVSSLNLTAMDGDLACQGKHGTLSVAASRIHGDDATIVVADVNFMLPDPVPGQSIFVINPGDASIYIGRQRDGQDAAYGVLPPQSASEWIAFGTTWQRLS